MTCPGRRPHLRSELTAGVGHCQRGHLPWSPSKRCQARGPKSQPAEPTHHLKGQEEGQACEPAASLLP